MNIKVIRMTTAEELIGEWDQEKSSITNPVVMVPVSKDKIGFQPWITSVSYTHLTLPTICSV